MRGWLAALARLPGLRAAPAAAAVRAAVARQLLDTDAGVQQAALKCLKVRFLRFFRELFGGMLGFRVLSHTRSAGCAWCGCMLWGATAAVLLLDMDVGMPCSRGLKVGTLSTPW